MGLRNEAEAGQEKATFANIGVYRPELFKDIAPGTHAKLGPLLRDLLIVVSSAASCTVANGITLPNTRSIGGFECAFTRDADGALDS